MRKADIGVTHTQESGTRNLRMFLALKTCCKFLTINTIDNASQKHVRPIKRGNFGHMRMQASSAEQSGILFGARSLYEKEKLVQESMTDACTSFWYQFLVKEQKIRFLSECPDQQHKSKEGQHQTDKKPSVAAIAGHV